MYRALAPGEQAISLGPGQSRQKAPLTEQVQGPGRGTEGSEHQPGGKASTPLRPGGTRAESETRDCEVRTLTLQQAGSSEASLPGSPCASRPYPALPLVKANQDPGQWSPGR